MNLTKFSNENRNKEQNVYTGSRLQQSLITFGMFLPEVPKTWQNARSGAVRKKVKILPLRLDDDEEDVEDKPLSSQGCMLGESSSIACSPLSSPLIDCKGWKFFTSYTKVSILFS